MTLCGYCNRDEAACICGNKKEHYRCFVCGGDVPVDEATYDAETNVPYHKSCATKLVAEMIGDGDIKPQNGYTRAAMIPLQFGLEVPYKEETVDADIKKGVREFLTALLFAFEACTFKFSPLEGVRAENFNLDKILSAQKRNMGGGEIPS